MPEGNGATSFESGSVRGFLHRPARPLTETVFLVVAHGAGGNSGMPLLVTLAEAFSAAGVWVLRCDLPFRQKRRRGPPYPTEAAADRTGLAEAVAAMRALAPGRVVLGGQSYGGRQASILSAEQPELADALLLLSYPLHPPGKPAQLRTAHFPSLKVPALFVHGSADPFGTLEEVRAALVLIPAATNLVEIEGAGHDLRKGKFDVANSVLEPLQRLIS